MTAPTLAIVVAVGFAVPAALYALSAIRHPLRRRSRLLVVTRSGETFRGALLRRHRDGLLLASAELLTRDGGQRLDGAVWIDRPNIAYVQAPEEA